MTEKKPWERPWSLEEMIENSSNWSLAGDVALLNTLKAFAGNLVKKTTEVNTKLQGLSGNLDETSLKLDLARNRFQSLRNSQFIESRVYEDDETLPQPEIVEKVATKDDNDKSEAIKDAVLKGLEVLDRYFDKIEVSVSDSEDDTDFPNYVLRPKDLYIDRPLPYVIGSEEWHKNWHVGLEDSSSDSETEKISDKYSDSGSESDLPLTFERSHIKGGSDSSSELDFSKNEPGIPTKTPTRDLFLSSDSEDQNSIPAQTRPSDKSFAEQLVEKLESVVGEPEINRRPIQTNTQPRYATDLFFDEPPPLDDGPKNAGFLSAGSGLFDDEDDGFFAQKPPIIPEVPKLSQQQLGLFDEDNSDDDIFNYAKPNPQPLRIDKPPLFAEEPPALETKKKPVGGVSIFGASNLFDRKLLKNRVDSDEEEKQEKKEIQRKDEIDRAEPVQVKQLKEEKSRSLFDDDDDLFNDNLFSSKSSNKKFTSNLFDDDESDDFFAPKTVAAKPGGLFDDFIPDDKNSINFDKSRNKNTIESQPKILKDNLFSSSPLESGDELFGDVKGTRSTRVEEAIAPEVEISPIIQETKENLVTTKIDSKPPQDDADLFASMSPKSDENLFGTERKSQSLFESPPLDDDELFGGAKSALIDEKIPEKITKIPKTGLFESSGSDYENATAKPSRVSLFDSTPPPDDEWDTKSDVSDFETEPPYREDAPQKWGLFDEEPPALDLVPPRSDLKLPSKVSDITLKFEKDEAPLSPSKPVTSPGKLKHNLKINVGALMPGSAPPKRSDETPPVFEDLEGETPTFDSLDNVEVLQNVTKDRVRVPFHRRPSTRRGRKAALKTSPADFKLDQENDSGATASPKSKTSDQDLKTTDLLENQDINSAPASATGISKTNLFKSKTTASASVSKTDLFDNQVTVSAPAALQAATNLFETKTTVSASVSKTDLFDNQVTVSAPAALQAGTNLFESKTTVSASVSKTDLFGNQVTASAAAALKPGTNLFDNKTTVSASASKINLFGSPERASANLRTIDLFDEMETSSVLKTKSALFSSDLFDDEIVSTTTSKAEVSKTDLFDNQEKISDLISEGVNFKTDLFDNIETNSAPKIKASISGSDLFDNQRIASALASRTNVLKSNEAVSTNLIEDLEADSETSKSNLFQNVKKSQTSKAPPAKIDLFDDDDEDDFLFATSKRKQPAKVNKSLFDDEDGDDDDIFKSSASAVKKSETKMAVERKVPKLNVRKLKNSKPDDDPLSALLD